MANFEIDLVYLWVNGNDPEWQAKRNATIGLTQEKSEVNCKARFFDNDELKYSLRSVELYAPWIRKIFIVTDNQTPRWLNVDNPKIQIVDHTQILAPENLPTFNSVTIEHALHRIPGLADHFLYANDDMFFNRPVTPEDFFTPDGKPIVKMVRRPFGKLSFWYKEKVKGKELSVYNKTIRNAARLVEKKFGKYYAHKPHHNIDAYSKELNARTFELFRAEIEPTLSNHVRTENDVQRIIYSLVPIAEKTAKLRFVTRKKSFRLHTHKHRHYQDLERLNPQLLCVNDSEFASDDDRKLVKEFLKKRFPEKSQFEI